MENKAVVLLLEPRNLASRLEAFELGKAREKLRERYLALEAR